VSQQLTTDNVGWPVTVHVVLPLCIQLAVTTVYRV